MILQSAKFDDLRKANPTSYAWENPIQDIRVSCRSDIVILSNAQRHLARQPFRLLPCPFGLSLRTWPRPESLKNFSVPQPGNPGA